MPDELPRVSEKLRVFLDGKEIHGGNITVADGPDGMLCRLNGRVVKILGDGARSFG